MAVSFAVSLSLVSGVFSGLLLTLTANIISAIGFSSFQLGIRLLSSLPNQVIQLLVRLLVSRSRCLDGAFPEKIAIDSICPY